MYPTTELNEGLLIESELRAGYAVITHINDGHDRGVSDIWINKMEAESLIIKLKELFKIQSMERCVNPKVEQ